MAAIELVQAANPSAQSQAAGAIRLGAINREHPEYRENAERWERLKLLHDGGYKLVEHAHRFLLDMPNEPNPWKEFRHKNASYVNNLAKLIGFLNGALFQEGLTVGNVNDKGDPIDVPDPFYKAFMDDCDLEGTDFSQFVRATVARALRDRRGLLCVDMPRYQQAVSRAEEEQLGLGRAYLYHVDTDELINWNMQEITPGNRGRVGFEWCILRGVEKDRSDPFSYNENEYRLVFKVWRLVDGVAVYAKYRSQIYSDKLKPRQDDTLQLIDGPTPTSFRKVPVLQLRLSHGLWAGNQAGPLCEEHFRDRSSLKNSMTKSLNEIMYVAQGSEIPAVGGAIPSVAAQSPTRGKDAIRTAKKSRDGVPILGTQDEVRFAGPSGRAHELTVQWLDKVEDDIHGSVNAMALAVKNEPTTIARSGVSKKMDRSPMGIVLGQLAYEVREFTKLVMDVIATARAEQANWKVTGLNTFDDEDRGEAIGEAVEMETVNIPSKTFKVIYKTDLALKLVPQASEEEKRQIRDEIKNGVENEADITEMLSQRTVAKPGQDAPPKPGEPQPQPAPEPPQPPTPKAP